MFAVGLYVYTAAVVTGAPVALASAFMAKNYVWPNPADVPTELSNVGIALAISIYLLFTSLAGLSGMLAAGGLWWNGSKNAIRLFITVGLLGSLGHSLPAVIGAAAGLWYDVGSAVGLVGVFVVAFPTLAYAILAALTFVALGGPPVGSDGDSRPEHE
jgi:hypothetical protein